MSSLEHSVLEYDVAVVGAGMGGLYAVYRFRNQGLSVVGIESAPEVGGVWYHNAYPGARVDAPSANYCFFFDADLYSDWKWTERYAAQPEILAYLNHVADRFDLRKHFLFSTRMTSAVWESGVNRYTLTTDTGQTIHARYLVMATGQLSKPRDLDDFVGLADFEGEIVQASHWQPVGIKDRRVAVIGTGSSGVQTATATAAEAAELYVLQRTPLFAVRAGNEPADEGRHQRMSARVAEAWQELLASPGGLLTLPAIGKTTDFTAEQQQAILEAAWRYGGTSILAVFTDIGVDPVANEIVGEFVRRKNRERVHDPETAAALTDYDVPIGVRRLILETGYYEAFNQDNVHLVDIKSDPIARFVPSGIELKSGRVIELDTVIFAIGFEVFTGSLDAANITNEAGRHPSDNWVRGPRSYLGLMTTDFPNLFLIAGPGSPSLTANVNLANVQHLDFVGELLAYMGEHGYTRVEPTPEAQDAWTDHANALAEPLIRRRHANYMVHYNADDGSQFFIPYAGGVANFVAKCNEVAANDYEGFKFE